MKKTVQKKPKKNPPPKKQILEKRIAELEIAKSKWLKAEKALKESEQNYKNLVEKAGICILIDDVNGNLFYFNEKLPEMLGYTPKELNNISIQSFIHPDDKDQVMDTHRRRMAGKTVPNRYNFRGIRKDGSIVYLEVEVTVLKRDQKIVGSRSYIWDISERKKSEKVTQVLHEISKAINESYNLDMLYPEIHKILWQIIDATNFYIALYDKHKDIIRFTYFTDEEDDDPEIRNASKSGSLTAEVINKKETILYTQEQLAKKYKLKKEEWGTQPRIWLGIPLTHKNEVIGVMAIQSYSNPDLFTERDIEILESVSETIAFAIQRKKAEEEKQKLLDSLRQAQKMEAIGTLAGGIAHDFNNILGVIIGYTDLLIREIPDQPATVAKLDKVLKAGLRAKEMVNQILTFSRKSDESQRPLYIGTIIKEVVPFLKHSLPTTIQINHHIASDEELVLANSTQIYQVIMNICTNAAQAIGEKKGKIELRLENVKPPDDLMVEIHPEISQYMCLSISDTGTGIPEEIIDHIFEPYFTTKKASKGTGMGLAVVHGIIKAAGGEIKVESESGKGSTFRIYLPVMGIDETSAEDYKQLDEIEGGHEHILFVDDELDLAHLGKLMLQKLGYQVISRTSSTKALEIYKKNPEKFDLVITDMTMPDLTGLQLVQEIQKIKPHQPVIICTGYNEHLTQTDIKSEGINAIVSKPLRIEDIAKVIRKVFKKTKITNSNV
jgi:PAS domain S-box-containing protein